MTARVTAKRTIDVLERLPSGPPRARLLSLAVSSFVLVVQSVALAEAGQAPACSDPRMTLDGPLDGSWTAAIAALCDELSTLPDIDPDVRLRVVASGADVIVEATLRDGRSTLRRVTRPSNLRLTVEALTTVPPRDPSPEDHGRAPAVSSHAASSASATPIAPVASIAPPLLRVEVGGAAMARVAGAPTYLSVGPTGYVTLRPGSWMLGVTARWEVLQAPTSGVPTNFEMDSVGAGFLVGRRFPLTDTVSLDIGVDATVIVEAQSFDDVKRGVEVSDSATDLRLGALTRLLLGTAPLQWTIAVDGEVSPARLRRAIRVDPAGPALPSVSFGLALGASWSEP